MAFKNGQKAISMIWKLIGLMSSCSYVILSQHGTYVFLCKKNTFFPRSTGGFRAQWLQSLFKEGLHDSWHLVLQDDHRWGDVGVADFTSGETSELSPSTAWSKKLEISCWIFLDHDFFHIFPSTITTTCGIPWYIPWYLWWNYSATRTPPIPNGPDPPIAPPISPQKKYSRSLRWGNELLHISYVLLTKNKSLSPKSIKFPL